MSRQEDYQGEEAGPQNLWPFVLLFCSEPALVGPATEGSEFLVIKTSEISPPLSICKHQELRDLSGARRFSIPI